MKHFRVSYQAADSDRWIVVGNFTARTSSGALQQFARDLRHFPAIVAIRAEEV